MKIFIDADACPVVDIVEDIATKYNIPVTLLCDTNHVLTSITAALSACVVLVPCFLAIVGREGASSLTEDIPFSKFGNWICQPHHCGF